MRIHFVSCRWRSSALAGVGVRREPFDASSGPTPNLEPTFASIQSEMFEKTDSAGRSACTTCHTSTGRILRGSLISITPSPTPSSSTRRPARRLGRIRVIPGDPANSYLINKLEGLGISGNRMPNNGPPYLTDGQIVVIKRWIEIGAPQQLNREEWM